MTTELHPKAKAACIAHGLTDIVDDDPDFFMAGEPGAAVYSGDGMSANAGIWAEKLYREPGWKANRFSWVDGGTDWNGPEYFGADCDEAVAALFAAEDAEAAKTDRDKISGAKFLVLGDVHFKVTATNPDVRIWCTHGDWYGVLLFTADGTLRGLSVEYTKVKRPVTQFVCTEADTLDKYMAGFK